MYEKIEVLSISTLIGFIIFVNDNGAIFVIISQN